MEDHFFWRSAQRPWPSQRRPAKRVKAEPSETFGRAKLGQARTTTKKEAVIIIINSIDIVGIKDTLPSFAGNSPVFIGEMEDKEIQVVTESSARSVLKGFTWRLVATFSTIVISYLITGETDIALKIGAIEFFAKIAVYYLHERMWLRIPFGKNTVVRTPEFEI